MHISQQLSAQIESLLVLFVKDSNIGLRPMRAQVIKTADFAVINRCCIRGENAEAGAL